MLLQWQKEFEVGVAPIDNTHRAVVDLLNELDVALTAGSPQAVVDRALDELSQLLAEHLHDRQDALARVQRLRRRQDDADDNSRRDLKILAHWWLAHLCGQDPAHPCAPAKPPSH